MSSPAGTLPKNGSGPWSIAGIRDCWLGGSHHNPADSEVAEHILLGAPHLAHVVRVYRALLGRLVRYLVEVGVRQFLDLGSGLPTVGNVHQVAQDFSPGARVVYVDINPDVVVRGHSLLAGNHDAVMVRADLRQPAEVLDATRRSGLLDLGAPVAVLAIDVLHHIPDSDNPARIVATYMDAVCPGSCLAVAHSDHDEALITGLEIFRDFYQIPVPPLTFRNLMQITKLFNKLDLVPPGIVPIPLWRQESNEGLSMDPETFPAFIGLGRKL